MDIRIIDTSVLVNILDIPNMNENHKKAIEEFKLLIQSEKDTLILPLATIIETGNHIAHISNGDIRRKKAELMAKYLEKTAKGEAPWEYYCKELDKEDLLKLSQDFPDSAMRETGIGDMSIIRAYEKYKLEVPAIGTIMIWSFDNHLQGYKEVLTLPTRRRSR
jgi:hypothetical protein